MLRKVLFILRKSPTEFGNVLLRKDVSPTKDASIILIHDGVALTQVPGNHVYVLSDDAACRNIKPAFPTISYRDMLRMIFDADAVIAL